MYRKPLSSACSGGEPCRLIISHARTLNTPFLILLQLQGSEARATCGCNAPLYALTTLGSCCALGVLLYTNIQYCTELNQFCHTDDVHGWKVTFKDKPGGKAEDPEEAMPDHLISD